MRLTEYDAFEMMSWVLDPAKEWTIVDAGAHEGVVAERLLEVFPRSVVYGFEPIPETFETLRARAERLPRLRPVNAALGDSNTTARMNVNKNSWTASFLPPSERGLAYHGDWLERERTQQVDVFRLDDWAAEHGVPEVHALKIDVQGFEGALLKGAKRLLRDSVVAVFSEAQLIPEYEGATTFGEIDAALRELGFGLHQIVDIQTKGELQETSCCDALWIKQPALDALRRNPPSLPLDELNARLRGVFDRLAARGLNQIAIYGAGAHTRTRLAEILMECPVRVACVIDDDPRRQGNRLWGFPIVSRDQAIAMGVSAVVLSSDLFEDDLWKISADIRAAGVEVIRLYGASVKDASPRRLSELVGAMHA
ncbi:MAG: FkbM family methyltransferase [Phycisphaeraceae bacterium]|nr:FkbM family methyltransferase [Phycisphaeraceae bacterium]